MLVILIRSADYLNGIEYLENVGEEKYGILIFCGCYR